MATCKHIRDSELIDQRTLWPEFLKAVRHEVIPALGCTEPVSLALASAIAARHLDLIPDRIEARVSANLMKNGMGVTVPGTGMVGLPIAAAVGALGGDPVLRPRPPARIARGRGLVGVRRGGDHLRAGCNMRLNLSRILLWS